MIDGIVEHFGEAEMPDVHDVFRMVLKQWPNVASPRLVLG